MSRILGILLLLAIGYPSAGEGQIDGTRILSASAPGEGAGPSLPMETERNVGLGLSGALRVVVVSPSTRLSQIELNQVGEGWEVGHRWIPVPGMSGPPLIGEPTTLEVRVGDDALSTETSRDVELRPGGDPRISRVLGEPSNRAGAVGDPFGGDADRRGPASHGAVHVLGEPAGPGPEPLADAPAILGEPAPHALELLTSGFTPGEIVAPEAPGVWTLESAGGATLTVITQVPASLTEAGRLNGYHIGSYPAAGGDRTDLYAPPSGFIEVTPANQHLRVTEHLTLGQFLTKDQFEVWPKYVALDMRLLDKLELVIQELRAMGVRANRIHVMSGFRTPQYNGPGGDGRGALSRHMWGDAADVWIDNFGTGLMDDLNGDGLVDMDDAAIVMRAVERVEQKHPALIGGAGVYPSTHGHGPYIHIDARGYHARW